ncbi:hypothetical protein [Risungbinella massiliensis]|uniref:hypothetical protein n=1 Tax=Risungbinella massiliensis TaxID=1329796 RepID=UPI0005CBE1B9|nr:hypothetical protein [Risungbinella massiliensis]
MKSKVVGILGVVLAGAVIAEEYLKQKRDIFLPGLNPEDVSFYEHCFWVILLLTMGSTIITQVTAKRVIKGLSLLLHSLLLVILFASYVFTNLVLVFLPIEATNIPAQVGTFTILLFLFVLANTYCIKCQKINIKSQNQTQQ